MIWKFECFDRSIYPQARIHTKIDYKGVYGKLYDKIYGPEKKKYDPGSLAETATKIKWSLRA